MIKFWLIALLLLLPTTNVLADSLERLHTEVVQEEERFRQALSLRERQVFRRVRWNERFQLSPAQRHRYERWQYLIDARKEFSYALDLKKALQGLHPDDVPARDAIQKEADQLASSIIKTFLQHKVEWHMVQPPLLQNILINMGVSDKGLCYQWAEAFMGVLRPLALHHFDMHWIVARQNKLLEHNAVSVTAMGDDWQNGLIIDGWRKSGRAFWRPVKGDDYPWKLVVREDEPL